MKLPSEKCLLLIYTPPALEETLVDWLLENDQISGFSSTEANGHGQRPSGLTLFEQVTGRQRRIQFTIETQAALISTLLESLSHKFQGVGLHYMVIPLLDSGRF